MRGPRSTKVAKEIAKSGTRKLATRKQALRSSYRNQLKHVRFSDSVHCIDDIISMLLDTVTSEQTTPLNVDAKLIDNSVLGTEFTSKHLFVFIEKFTELLRKPPEEGYSYGLKFLQGAGTQN